jgi:small subunit ribosomal protein S18
MAGRKRFFKKNTGPCPFCKAGATPDYKEYKDLARFLTDRAKILGKERSGVCTKHQRKLTVEIKRARHLGLLPYSPRV